MRTRHHWEHQEDWGKHAPKASQQVEGKGEFREEQASIIWATIVEQKRAASLCMFGNYLHRTANLIFSFLSNKQYSENSGFVSFVGLFKVSIFPPTLQRSLHLIISATTLWQ